ncbi:hypothetical protein FRB93_008171 [Tulasnella sp. JGI-2019a]|nr:hypothetical protein FRB93_008171 [Tulasnella sp. JGI-2019a]
MATESRLKRLQRLEPDVRALLDAVSNNHGNVTPHQIQAAQSLFVQWLTQHQEAAQGNLLNDLPDGKGQNETDSLTESVRRLTQELYQSRISGGNLRDLEAFWSFVNKSQT